MAIFSRTRQIDVRVETKTEDDVFVQMVLAVHYHDLADKAYAAFRNVDDTGQQITAAVYDAVDTFVGTIKLEDVFARKDAVADTVKVELAPVMLGLGYGITKALVSDIRMRGFRDRWAPSASQLRGVRPLPDETLLFGREDLHENEHSQVGAAW